MRELAQNIGILGAGAWGTALARHLAQKFGHARIWAYERDVVESINARHLNEAYLPGIALPEGLSATNDLQSFAEDLSLLVVVVPSHVLRCVVGELACWLRADVPIVCASKGIENDTLMTMDGVLTSVLGARTPERLSILSGPSFAYDVARGKATAVSLAGRNETLCREIQTCMSNGEFRAYTTPDVLGVELGGALKNVIAIAAGASVGLGLGHNATAALVTRGLAEMTRLCVKCGGEALTLSGLSGLGDLALTCYGELSRNRDLGYRLGRGESFESIQASRITVAEGVKTAASAYALSVRCGVEMPIVQRVYECLYEGKAPAVVLSELMGRDLKRELEFSMRGH